MPTPLPMAGLYIHIPFCRQACHYCDFHFSVQRRYMDEMIAALAKEIRMQQAYLDEPPETIYFGGGTPSLLDASQLHTLFAAIRASFRTDRVREVTLEANPDDLTEEKLEMLKASGINRLSIGIQSLDDQALRLMNRAHDAKVAIRCLENVRNSGFDNINIDLIYAIPNQAEADWLNSLDQLIRYRPQHLSAYALTIEEKTVFGKWARSKKLLPVGEEESAAQFERLIEKLELAGYEQYEISNFALPGHLSVHNTNYWRDVPYLGIGPGAHSYNRVSRQWNVRSNAGYVKAINSGTVPFEREVLTRENKINEYIYTSLRTKWGCDLQKLLNDHRYDLRSENPTYLRQLTDRGMAVLEDSMLRLLKPGRLVADQIALELFLPV